MAWWFTGWLNKRPAESSDSAGPSAPNHWFSGEAAAQFVEKMVSEEIENIAAACDDVSYYSEIRAEAFASFQRVTMALRAVDKKRLSAERLDLPLSM
jgi:hypothetical protein